jgi:anti-anti-sigma factor
VVADEDSIAYEINKHHLSSIMQKNPRLIEVLSELMADRHSATQQQALLQALAAENNRAAGNLMKKMRDFFWIKKNLIKPKTQNFKKIKISSINNINIYNLQSIEEKMEINSETLENGVLRVSLSGRLDVLGAQNIDIKFTALTATKKASILVDISEVSFLASLGMRTLISSAKALSHRGGFMVLYKPQPNVAEVLETAGVTSLIPVYDDYENAINALLLHQDN